ncbi:uncharacterized protein C2orf73-like [Erpetoichthys calabaricus]|uniref:uncharacterized protein C2orf73-like n=1 Tax=Erpetoichthys calabaricus TaxID=27687 RepID=UPI00223419CF|nr:uncharacterized protein C2orf73-like [Erpetoichthys calabaricus]
MMFDSRKMDRSIETCGFQKKRVPSQFYSNTFRIFDENLSQGMGIERYNQNYVHEGRKHLEQQNLPNIHNVPHPHCAKVIRTNPRTLNESIWYMESKRKIAEQSSWWPNYTDINLIHTPPYSRESTQRSDFSAPLQCNIRNTRFGSNPHKSPTFGIVPTISLSGAQNNHVHRISFIHNYDSRKVPNEPIRGKRHGAFVWREIKSTSGLKAPSGSETFPSTEGSQSPPVL